MSAGDRQHGLSVELVDGRLVIAIGVDALMTAVQGGDDWDEERWQITDPDAFAAGIVRGLEREEEDGTTLVHLAIDGAAQWALEQGEEGVDEIEAEPDDEGDGSWQP